MRTKSPWLVLATLLAATTARAQEEAPPAEPWRAAARAAVHRGEEAYDRSQYTEAEDAFREAMDAMPADFPTRPLVWLNIAQCIERQTGRDQDALATWQRFRREAANVAEPELLVRADDRIRELTARIARRGARTTSEISPVGPIVIGVGGAALIAAAITGGILVAQNETLVSMCSGDVCPTSARSLARDVERLAIATDVLWIGGTLIAATGVVLMLLLRDERLVVTAACTTESCMLGMMGSF